MPYEDATARYRQLYGFLLHFYPKSYRERFGAEMGQVFNDLCRERMGTGKRLFAFVLWMCGETFVGIISIRISYFFTLLRMQKSIIRLALITAGLLLIPLISMQFENGADWTVGDFIFAGVLIFGIGLAYILISRKSSTTQYKLAVGLGLAGAFFLVWVSGAVGIIGDPEDGTADLPNLMYFVVLAIGFFGSILSRFNPRGMSLTLFAAAAVQFVIPFIVFAINRPLLDDAPGMMGVFILNSAFAMFFAGSGMLFRQAMQEKKA